MNGGFDRNVERWALLVFYSMLVITMAVEVLRRELFAYSSIWGEEIVRYCFIYLAWIGAAAAVKDRAHIRIDVIYQFCSNRVRGGLYLIGDLVMLGVSIIALYWSIDSVHTAWKYSSVTHGLRVSLALFLAAVPIGFSLLVYRLLQSMARDVRALMNGEEVFEGGQLFDEESK